MDRPNRLRRLRRQDAWLSTRLDRLAAISLRVTWARVALFLAGSFATIVAAVTRGAAAGVATGAAATLLFIMAVVAHRRLERAIARHAGWRDLRREQAARLALDWEGLPPPAEGKADAEHPFARDLDLSGPRSVLHRIDRCATVDGSRVLRSWLLRPVPDLAAARERQALVQALAPRHRLRDRLVLEARLAGDDDRARRKGLAGQRADGRWDVDATFRWLLDGRAEPDADALDSRSDPIPGSSPASPASTSGPWSLLRPVRVLFQRVETWLLVLSILVGLSWALLFAEYVLGRAPGWWQVTWGVYAVLVLLAAKVTGDTFGEAMRLEGALRRVRAIFMRLEGHDPAGSSALAALLAPFHDADARPSREIRRAMWIAAGASVRGNPLIWLLLNAALPWDFLFAWWLQRLRRRLADELPAWLAAWHTLEALDAFADMLHLDPRWTMPELVAVDASSESEPRGSEARGELADPDADGGTPFLAVAGLVHPLLSPEGAVANDLTLGRVGEIAIITGSNMSGKSTFLRAVGTSVVLAQAGGPVPARSLSLAPCRVFSVGRIDDSVTAGISFFYGEVRRLAELLAAVRDHDGPPVLFTIDEIFRGTNNRERLLGSQAYLEALAGGRVVGLVATHDLELTALVDTHSALRNLHFRDDVVDERMVFDYRVHPGPCPTTNALRIMRAAGLPAPEPTRADDAPTA